MSDKTLISLPLTPAQILARLESLQTAVKTLVTTVALTIDSVAVDTYAAAKWIATFTKSDGAVIVATVNARHNGTASADATTAKCTVEFNGDETPLSELTTLDVDLSGSGTSQVMRLRGTMTYGSDTWKVTSQRIPMKPPQYA